jgi:DNA-binding response OmpR family regulator
VYPLPAEDANQREVAVPQVTVVTVVTSPTTAGLAGELRRDAIRVEVAAADVLRTPPSGFVYLFCLDAAIAVVLAERIVHWATTSEHRPGLIGIVEDGATSERETLLAAGFDDVVAGPLSARELAARVRAVHRRVHWKGITHGRLRYGAFTLDLDGHSLWVEGKIISLTSIELAVLRELMKARGKPLSRTELLDAAWGEGELEVSERAVDNVILRLRRKLPRPDIIETVRSVGFRIAPR